MKSLTSKPSAQVSKRERCASLTSSSLLAINTSLKNLRTQSPDRKEPESLPSHRSTTATSTKSSNEKNVSSLTQEPEKMGPSPFKAQSQPQQKFLLRASKQSRRKLTSSAIAEAVGPQIERFAQRRSVESTPRNKRLGSFHCHSYLNLSALHRDLRSLSICKERSFSKKASLSGEWAMSSPRLGDLSKGMRTMENSPLVRVQDYLKGTPR